MHKLSVKKQKLKEELYKTEARTTFAQFNLNPITDIRHRRIMKKFWNFKLFCTVRTTLIQNVSLGRL